MRSALEKLRTDAADATGQELPKIVPMRRIRARDFVLTAMVAIAVYLLITQLAKIGFGTIADELRDANVAWVVLGLVLAQIIFLGRGISLRGSVATPLPLLPCVVLQSAIKFINLTVPSSAGRIGITIRFLQRMGTPTPQAVAAGAVDDVRKPSSRSHSCWSLLPFVDLAHRHERPQDQRSLWSTDHRRPRPPRPDRRRSPLDPTPAHEAPPAHAQRDLEPLDGGPRSQETAAALRGEHRRGVPLRARPRLRLPCLRDPPHLRAADPRQHGGFCVRELDPGAGRRRSRRGQSDRRSRCHGRRRLHCIRDRVHHRLCTYYLPPIWGYFSMRWLSRGAYI